MASNRYVNILRVIIYACFLLIISNDASRFVQETFAVTVQWFQTENPGERNRFRVLSLLHALLCLTITQKFVLTVDRRTPCWVTYRISKEKRNSRVGLQRT